MLNFHSQIDCYTAMLYSQVILLNMSTGHNFSYYGHNS